MPVQRRYLPRPAALLAVSACAALPSVASAQTGTASPSLDTNPAYAAGSNYGPIAGDWEFLLGGSGTSDRDFDNNLVSVDASIGNYLQDWLLVGARQNVGIADSESDSSWNGSTVLFADYVFNFDRFRPFVGVTFGGLYGDDVDDTFIAGPQAGVKYYAKDDTFVFGRVNYDFLFESADDADSAFDDGRFVYTIGIGFNF